MNKTFFDEFIAIVSSQKNLNDLQAFFKEILTPKELEEIPKRLQIVKMLKQGKPQRNIADELQVGIATVTRGSRELQKGSFKNVYQKEPSHD